MREGRLWVRASRRGAFRAAQSARRGGICTALRTNNRNRLHCDQAAAVPYRWRANGPEVLLVTSRSTHRWVVPKGTIKHGLSACESAAEEAYEEAGVGGHVGPSCIGIYSYVKTQGRRTVRCLVRVYLLRVTASYADWPERGERRREWMSLANASIRVREPALRKILSAAHTRLKERGGSGIAGREARCSPRTASYITGMRKDGTPLHSGYGGLGDAGPGARGRMARNDAGEVRPGNGPGRMLRRR
jgi:8-oxo-dGTP pyrophosphatase MutT (NUDIX family)